MIHRLSPRHLAATTAAALGLLVAPAALADITYTLQFDPASSPQAQQVANSVAVAAAFYNQHGSFNKHWNVYYNSGIPTAEANYNGYMGYGGTRNERVVFHEAAHTFGMGTHGSYNGLLSGGVWQGKHGNQAQAETYNTYADGLHGDGHAIWPGGFNYDNEDGFIQRHWHTRVMAGIRADMGILSYTREAENELVQPGGTAQFQVTSPVGVSFQWYKDGTILLNGLRVSGANTATLRIANATAADEGSYHCAATGAGETLNSRPRRLWVRAATQLAKYDFNNAATDSSGNGHHATATGGPLYLPGKYGQAIDLDGVDDFLQVPAPAVLAKQFTIAAWVNWDGGANWQRLFDFGTGQFQYVFLTPKSGSGTMRLAFRDAINGLAAEKSLDTAALTPGQWTHLAVTLQGDQASFYVNGSAVGSLFGVTINPSDFQPNQNFIGKSQYNDPLFDGRVDDFRIYNHALSGAEIWDLAGQTGNTPPAFAANPLVLPDATEGSPYTGQSLATHASDADGDTLTFLKLNGPAWLTVAANGALSGVPGSGDTRGNSFIVRVTDQKGASSQTEVRINVIGIPPTKPMAYWTFEEGTADAVVPYGPTSAGRYDGSMLDVSGNGNHLSTWDKNWHRYRTQKPAATTPQTGAANNLSVQNANSYPAMSAIGTALTQWSPAEWTIEAAIRPDNATSGYQAIVGRDSQGAFPGDPALAALYFNINPNGGLRIQFTDAARNNWSLSSAANAVQSGKWHAVAATSNGRTLSLYLKNLTNGDTAYSLLGTLDISASADPAIHKGSSDGTSWDPGVFTVGRGLWNGGHTDRFFGHLDDVRLFGKALTPFEFLYSDPNPPAAPTGLAANPTLTGIALNWTPAAGAASYKVKRSVTAGGPYSVLASGLANPNHLDDTVAPGASYYYVVSAVNPAGESPNSAEIRATAAALPPAQVHLRLDESGGTSAADSSGNGRHGTVVNGATFAAGRINNALNFDGTDDHVTLPAGVVNGLTDFTAAVWVKWNGGTLLNWHRIFDFGTGATNYLFLTPQNSANGRLRFAIKPTSSVTEQIIDGTAALPTGVWTHVAVTLSGTTGTLYVNGSAVGTNAAMTFNPSSLGATTLNYLGRSQFPADPYFNGSLDEFQIHGRALAATEIAALAAPPAAPAGLAATATQTEVGLTWNAVAGASAYHLKRATAPAGPFTTIAANLPGTSHTDTAVTPGTTYHYVVTAAKGVAESANSSVVSATPLTAAMAWRQLHFGSPANTGDAADGADPDRDSISNLLERAFGGNPNAADAGILPKIDPSAPALSILYQKSKTATDLNFQIQESTDLAPAWTPATGTSEILSDDGAIQQLRFTRPAGSDGTLFLRLRVTAGSAD